MRTLVATMVLAMIPVLAVADTLNYTGETTSYTSYSGTNASSTAWDYVYSIQDWPGYGATPRWGIVTGIAPDWIYDQTGAATGWAATYYTDIPELHGLNDIWHKAGIVWQATSPSSGSPDYFHFQTAITGPGFPVHQLYDGDGSNFQNKSSQVYSANPEPGTLGLMCLVFAAGQLWRKRRARLAQD